MMKRVSLPVAQSLRLVLRYDICPSFPSQLMSASFYKLPRVLLTNDDGIDAPGLAVLESVANESWPTKYGLSHPSTIRAVHRTQSACIRHCASAARATAASALPARPAIVL